MPTTWPTSKRLAYIAPITQELKVIMKSGTANLCGRNGQFGHSFLECDETGPFFVSVFRPNALLRKSRHGLSIFTLLNTWTSETLFCIINCTKMHSAAAIRLDPLGSVPRTPWLDLARGPISKGRGSREGKTRIEGTTRGERCGVGIKFCPYQIPTASAIPV